jgi:hypothetical protein
MASDDFKSSQSLLPGLALLLLQGFCTLQGFVEKTEKTRNGKNKKWIRIYF